MVEHLGWVVAVVAAVGLIKFAIDNKERWWRLIAVLLVLGMILAGLIFAARGTGWQFGQHAGPGRRLLLRPGEGIRDGAQPDMECTRRILDPLVAQPRASPVNHRRGGRARRVKARRQAIGTGVPTPGHGPDGAVPPVPDAGTGRARSPLQRCPAESAEHLAGSQAHPRPSRPGAARNRAATPP